MLNYFILTYTYLPSDFLEKHNLQHYVELNTQVVSAYWIPQEGIYKLQLRDPRTGQQREDWSHVLVNATGNLNKWKCESSTCYERTPLTWGTLGPDIEGLHSFSGPMMHSANWDESVDFKDKVVGGNTFYPSNTHQIDPSLQ